MGEAIIKMRGGIKDPIESLEITTSPTKTRYVVGEQLDLTGIIVTAIYKNGQQVNVTNDCTFSPANGATLASADKTIVASWNFGRKTYTASLLIDVVSMSEFWEKGTDEEVVSMITAARQGTYSLSDYWKVGDKRTITISSMDGVSGGEAHNSKQVVIAITEFGGKTLQDGSTCLLQWDCIDVLDKQGAMNTSATNSGGYDASSMATWLDNVCFNALPSWLKGVSKQFYMTTGTGSGSGKANTTLHSLGLRTEKEVFGNSNHSQSAEAQKNTQISYYNTTANRRKSYRWWLASDYYSSGDTYGNQRYFCSVCNDSLSWADSMTADSALDIAPYGCI